jgi:hypothetical protein
MDSAVAFTAMTIYFALCSCLGVYVASQKGRPLVEGVVFGMLLGPFGVLIIACLPTLDVEAAAPDPPAMERRLLAHPTPQEEAEEAEKVSQFLRKVGK